MTMHPFPYNVYGSTIIQVLYYTSHAQWMLHPHISCEAHQTTWKYRDLFGLAYDIFVLCDSSLVEKKEGSWITSKDEKENKIPKLPGQIKCVLLYHADLHQDMNKNQYEHFVIW